MKCDIAIAIFIACFLPATTGYIVDSVNGNDNNDGETIDSPFQTISRCAKALANPGDACQIRDGYYHEVVTVTGLQGRVAIAKNVCDPFCISKAQEPLSSQSKLSDIRKRGRCGTER